MRLLSQSILVVFAGLLLASYLIENKRGRGIYFGSISSRLVAPDVARHYWEEAVRERPELAKDEDPVRAGRLVRERFREDLRRIEWTWDRELRWTQDPNKSATASSPPVAPCNPVP